MFVSEAAVSGRSRATTTIRPSRQSGLKLSLAMAAQGHSPCMLQDELLREQLPESLPVAKPRGVVDRQREIASYFAADAIRSRMPAQDVVDRRVRRGSIQALVLDAYLATLAEQDCAWRKRWPGHMYGGHVAIWPYTSEPPSTGQPSTHADRLYPASSRLRSEICWLASSSRSQKKLLGSVIAAYCPGSHRVQCCCAITPC